MSNSLDDLLPEICRLLDTCKADFERRGLWTEWDQSVRDRIAAYNLAKLKNGAKTVRHYDGRHCMYATYGWCQRAGCQTGCAREN